MKRQALVVLGMHRTGTSALTGTLVRLGVDGPRTIVPPDDHNPRGYWESDQLNRFHERLLSAARTSWDGWTSVDPAWLAPDTPFSHELRRLLDDEYGASSLFVVKDPRICRLVPAWLNSLDGTVEAKVIITIRSPGEVAASLAARDGIAAAPALLAWLRHVLDAEHGTRHVTRSFVSFHDLLSDWRAVADRLAIELAVSWPDGDQQRDDIAAFVDPGLRHHEGGIPDVRAPLSEWLHRTIAAFDLLLQPDGARRSEALSTLDDVKGELDTAAGLFGEADESARHEWRARATHAEASQDEWRGRATHAEAAHAELARRVAGLTIERDALHDRAEGIAAERNSLIRRVEDLEVDLEAHRREIEQFRSERDDLLLRLDGANVDRESLRRQVVGLDHALAAARHQVDAMLSSYSWRVTAPGRSALGWLRRRPVRSAPSADRATSRGGSAN